MKLVCEIILGVIYLVLSVIYVTSMMRKEPEEEPELRYTNELHERIQALYETDNEIQLVRDMLINLNTADCPIDGDALRSMDIYWSWGGKLEQNTAIPVGKGTPTAEAMRNLAEVRKAELIQKLSRELAALPFPEKS